MWLLCCPVSLATAWKDGHVAPTTNLCSTLWQNMRGDPVPSLADRVHIVPGSLAQLGGQRQRSAAVHFDTPATAMQAVEGPLAHLPAPLISAWLATPAGHIILNTDRHEFVADHSYFRKRKFLAVAWLKLAYASDPVAFLSPAGRLLAWLIGWRRTDGAKPLLKAWNQFENGVETCFRAGYGQGSEAQNDIDAYLAQGIAAFLVDRRALNVRDPETGEIAGSDSI